jgi:hypothetical protein
VPNSSYAHPKSDNSSTNYPIDITKNNPHDSHTPQRRNPSEEPRKQMKLIVHQLDDAHRAPKQEDAKEFLASNLSKADPRVPDEMEQRATWLKWPPGRFDKVAESSRN